jgi:hypothetical protein
VPPVAAVPRLLWLQGFDVAAMWADLDKLEAAAQAARAMKEKLSS